MTPGLTQCPACGGDVHPIAGRCKHCKIDLVEYQENLKREARRQRANTPAPAPAPAPVSAPAPAPAPQPVPQQVAQHKSQPHADHRGQIAVQPPQQAPVQPRPTTHRAPPPSFGHHGYPAQQSMWSRRWPLIAGAIALLAIGVSAGILIEQARHGSKNDRDGKRSNRGRTPTLVPDTMPDPGTPGIRNRNTSSAVAVDDFGPSMVNHVCTKLTDCGLIDDNVRATCRTAADTLRDPYIAGRVSDGECTYDESLAESCLAEIDDMPCSGASSNFYDMLERAKALSSCVVALVCK
jgi:hypothetical protein